MPDWSSFDLSHHLKIPSSNVEGLELTLRHRGSGKPVLFVHGATFSGRIFDIPDPRLNWLQVMADSGFASYALDIRGYGLSQPDNFPEGGPYATGYEAIEDITDAVTWISARHGGEQVLLVGWSWGTLTTARYALGPGRNLVKGLCLYAPIYGERNQEWIDLLTEPGDRTRLRSLGPYRKVDFEDTRLRWNSQIPEGAKGWRDDQVMKALVEGSIHDDGTTLHDPDPFFRVPNGTLVDLWECFSGRPIYDPSDLSCPTLLIRGTQDPTSTRSDALALFDRLGMTDRDYVEINGGTHFINAERRAAALFDAVSQFACRLN